MKKILLGSLLTVSLLTLPFTPGCSTSQQLAAFKTIGTTETLVLNANAAFLDSVVTGKTPTNSVPTVEAAFNDTQMALHLAAALASGGTNAPVPAAVQVKADNFINLATPK